jgi:hypothetical protein
MTVAFAQIYLVGGPFSTAADNSLGLAKMAPPNEAKRRKSG